MNTTSLMDDFEQSLKNTDLPNIDVKQQVMNKISVQKRPKGKLIAISLLIVTLLVSTIGFMTVTKIWKLNGPNNTQYAYHSLEDDGNHGWVPSSKYADEFKKMVPGEYLAVMSLTNNPKNTISFIPKPIITVNLEELYKTFGESFKAPDYLPKDYHFVRGEILYKFDPIFTSELLKIKDSTSTKDFVSKIIKPTNELSECTLIYENGNNQLRIDLTLDFPTSVIASVSNKDDISVMKIHGFDAVFEDKWGGNLKWLEIVNDSTVYHSIMAIGQNTITKEEYIKIAESMK